MASRSVSVRVPEDELQKWQGHASTQGMPIGEWIYRAVRLVLETDIPGTTTITGKPKRLLSRVMTCFCCDRKLDHSATRRRQYCSAKCRVRAWRAREAARTPEGRRRSNLAR